MLYGGVSSGRTVTDNCATPDVPDQFCRQTLPLTEFKLSGVQPLPWWGLQVSATYQNLPGVPQAATYLATNAEIAPSLGRNLSACPAATGPCNATALVQIIEPFTVFEARQHQLDVRFSRILRMGRFRAQGNVDVYNLFNASDVINFNTRYGATWLIPTSIIGGRFFKFSAQLDF